MDINSASLEVEKRLLSALMIDDGEVIPEISAMLKPSDFYRPEHQLIYSAILAVSDKDLTFAPLMVEKELDKRGDLAKVTRQYLYGLIDYEYTTLRAKYYADEIKRLLALRTLVELGKKLITEASDDINSPEELAAFADQKITSTVQKGVKDIEHVQPIAVRLVEEISRRQKQGGLQGISTGFRYLDRVTGGLKKSDLIILAARPSMGKTALALNIAAEAARKNTVAMFSLEMSKEQLTQRLFSSLGKIPEVNLQRGDLSEEEWTSLIDAVGWVGELKLHIDDTAALSLFDLRQRARRLKREQGLDLIVVDYIQLMQGSKEYRGNRVQEVSELSRGLKALARELDIPVVVLSQLSRAVEMRAEKKPQLSDLRESGSIEQDADIVMFLYREEYYNKESEKENLAEIIIAKNRNGATGIVPLYFAKEILQFSELTREERYER